MSDVPDGLPAPSPGEEGSYEGDPAELIERIQDEFLYHCWVVSHPNPHFGPGGDLDG